jgi:phage terminase large subunit-like protein
MAKYRGSFSRTVQYREEKEIYVEADNFEQASEMFESIQAAISEEDAEVVLERYPGTTWKQVTTEEPDIVEEAEFQANLGKKRP